MDVIQVIKERRSINFFETGKEIPDDKLKELLEIANLSPSSFNLQPWKVVVVKEPEKKKILKQCAFNQPVEEASVVLILVADPNEECIKREFNIPADKIIPMLIAVGYLRQGITLLPRAFRRKVDEFVKFERY